MSAQEIIEQLPKLDPEDLDRIRERLRQLEAAHDKTRPGDDAFSEAIVATAKSRSHWPADYALNHGYYVSGEPKK